MEPVVGSEKQEKKIRELGAIANEMFPDFETMIFKGSFRLGIESALKKNRYRNWGDVSRQPPIVRKRFFQTILDESESQLKGIGLKQKEIERLTNLLKRKNEKYL